MTKKIKIHDGIVGALVLVGLLLSWRVDARLLALPGLVALVMMSSAFTGFCPVHWLVGKLVRS